MPILGGDVGAPSARLVVPPSGAAQDRSLRAAIVSSFDAATDGAYASADVAPSVVALMDNNIPIVAIEDAATGARGYAAYKSVADGGPMEVFASHVADAANMGRIVERAHRLASGAAAIPMVPGRTMDNFIGYDDGGAILHRTLTRFHARHGAGDPARAALDDIERILAFDASMNQPDRSSRNLVRRPDRDVRIIDNAFVVQHADGATRTAVDPTPMKTTFIDSDLHRIDELGWIPKLQGERHDIHISNRVADDFGNVTVERLAGAFEQARVDAHGVEGRYAIGERFLDDVARRASWIAEHAIVPIIGYVR